MVTLRTSKSAFSEYNNNIYNKNNAREYNIVHGESIQVGKHCYLVCIPDLPTVTTKMEVARAVERRILYSSTGEIIYVKNVVFVEGFDEESKNAIENSCYKIAIVNIEMTPNEHGVYTDYENEFYESICRGDLLVGEWSNSFLMANPNYYFKSLSAVAHEEAAAQAQAVAAAAQSVQSIQTEAAFQKWKHGVDIAKYKCKVHEGEAEILELQNTVNELLESLRFLSRKRSGEGLLGLKDASKSVSSFLSTLNNKYARICVSDVEFLEINKNMKLKKLLGLVVNVCDDCDACQELIHSLDYIEDEERRRYLFVQIETLICRINHSIRKFQLLHLYAERCIFGLKNRAVFTEFASFLNTAVEIVEEVTSRNCTHTQDVDFVKCYGIRATSKQEQEKQEKQEQEKQQDAAHDGSCVGDYYSGSCWDGSACTSWDGSNGYDGITVNNNHYDYYENADNVESDEDANEEMTSVSQMLAEFDAMRALTASATTATADSVVEDTVEVEQQVVIAANESEEAELVITATAVKEEEQREEKENETNNSDTKKGKWFSWF